MTRLITFLVLIIFISACAPAPTPTATLTPSAIPATATPEPTVTATATEIPKGLADRWNEPEVMARVWEKFEENRGLFDQIEAGTLIYHGENGREINVRDSMQGYYYSDSSVSIRRYGDYNLSAGAVGKRGLLLTHESLQYSPDMEVEVAYFVFYNNNSVEKPFEIVAFVLGATDVVTGEFAAVRLGDVESNSNRGFNSKAELITYLDSQVRNGLPLYDTSVTSVVDTITGSREPEAMEKEYLRMMYQFDKLKDDTLEKDVMQRFILDYYTDSNYQAFIEVKSEQTAAGWGGADLWAGEAAKTRVGLVDTLPVAIAK